MLLGHAEVLTPLFDVSDPLGWSIWVQPSIGRNTVDDDRGVSKPLKKSLLSCVLKPLMCVSIRVWISAGGFCVSVVFGGACAKDFGTVNASVAAAIAARRVVFPMRSFDMDLFLSVLTAQCAPRHVRTANGRLLVVIACRRLKLFSPTGVVEQACVKIGEAWSRRVGHSQKSATSALRLSMETPSVGGDHC